MTTPIQHPTSRPGPDAATFSQFVHLGDRDASEQQHGYPFKPQRLPEAPVSPDPDKGAIEPEAQAGAGDDDLMSHDINAPRADHPA